MINLNTVSNVSNVQNQSVNQNSTVAKEEKNAFVNTGASTVVDLQTKVTDSDAKSSFKVDSSNAKSMVADIAAMLGGASSTKVQANLNGFDAARLLA